jgi:uncharacterized protein (DUF2249 family)
MAPNTADVSEPTGIRESVRARHAELAEQLQARTSAVLGGARAGDCTKERDELHEWYRALYGPAADIDTTRLLISGMLTEHRALVTLMADLALARQALDVATIAASAQALFRAHVSKENDLLLPALEAAGLDLATVLDGMHDIVDHAHPAADPSGGCNCGHEGCAAELDVRELPHGQRHEIIFGKLSALAPGEALLIVNDHDPKPLRYQFQAENSGEFSWEYLEEGPEVWRVRIGRTAA